ncbi:rhotekin-2 isoform X2 [Ascaphus truei]|uniref:rhotekin-2 isoform X2 n=1 Tax=Ascaphus truei TaxID=8439 RepID=UPI003F59F8F4
MGTVTRAEDVNTMAELGGGPWRQFQMFRRSGKCPAAITNCPAAITNCPAAITNCPAAITNCPAAITNCPAAITNCPAAITNCPASISNCPASISNCPAAITNCPAAITNCPAAITNCPAAITNCPAAISNCPAAISNCPAAISNCPAAISNCPAAISNCPAAITNCPAAISNCPAAITNCPAAISNCPALGMEIKRKKISERAIFPQHNQYTHHNDNCIQEKLDFEIRMREGICKLLSVSTQKDQVLNAVKNLMTCTARIQGYTTQLHSPREESCAIRRSSDAGMTERVPCPGKVAISGIRIPLMWKNSEHFSNKEKSQRYAVFCMLKLGQEIFDTDMVIVDKTMTDICFENITVFTGARPDFQLKLEVYSCCIEDYSITNTPKKLARKLRNSIGKSSGKKFNLELEEPELEAFLLPKSGAKYNILAHITFTLDSIEDNFRTHTLTVSGHEESSYWLPLYGSMCCRLVAQPSCMTDDVMMGFLNQKQLVGGLATGCRLFCVLKGGNLLCYYTREEIEAKIDPTLTVPINKETRIRAVEKDSKKRTNCFSVINLVSGEAVTKIFAADSKEQLQKWMEVFWQHFYDLSQWKHCSEECMKIEIMSLRKPPLFLTKEATSVYHDISIGSPVKLESLTDILNRKIEETDGQFLIGQPEESALPPWGALCDGNHLLHFEKNKLSPISKGEELNPLDGKMKKRRAPPPPPNKTPYSAGTQESIEPMEKENLWPRGNFSRKSFDTKLSAIMHQLQRPMAAARKPMAYGKISVTEDKNETYTEYDHPSILVPVPRQKSVKEKLEPRSRLQLQE